MDTSKWKSVAVKIGDYKILKALCHSKFRSPNSMITKLVNDYCEFKAKKSGISVEDFKRKLLDAKNKTRNK